MAPESILYKAHNLGIREEVLNKLDHISQKNPHMEIKPKLEAAFNEVVNEKKAEGNIETHLLESSMLHAATYNNEKETLVIEFTNGVEYSYSGVTRSEFVEFLNAESKGKHFIENFRSKKEYTKVNDN